LAAVVLGLGLGGPSLTTAGHYPEPSPLAPETTWAPETCINKAECGDFGPLLPIHGDTTGGGIFWDTNNWEVPQFLSMGRHSEVRAKDMYDTACLEQLYLDAGYSAWPVPTAEWTAQFPSSTIDPSNPFRDADTVEFFDPIGNTQGNRAWAKCFRSSFKHLVMGGYDVGHRMARRLHINQAEEVAQVWDLRHPDAFANRGVFDNALLTDEDAQMNAAAFKPMGYSKGLYTNHYSLGYAALEDGRILHIGGHNMNSSTGPRALNVFNPENEAQPWAPRPIPCMLENWYNDEGGVALGYQTYADAYVAAHPNFAGGDATGLGEFLINPPPGAPMWPGCDTRVADDTDPPHPSNMRYGRWYPSGVTLPNGWVLIATGNDQDTTVGPNEAEQDFGARDAAFVATHIKTPVPEIYIPETDTTVALENARKHVRDSYGPLYVVGTQGANWEVCMMDGQSAPASEASVPRSDDTNEAEEWRLYCDEPGCAADTRAIAGHNINDDPPSHLDCLDVMAAYNDPARNIPAENHWRRVDTYHLNMGRAEATNIIKIGRNGETLSHKIFKSSAAVPNADLAYIDMAAADPQIETLVNIFYQNHSGYGMHLTPLPDGTILNRGGTGKGDGSTGYENRQYTKVEIFNPDDNSIRVLAKSTNAGAGHKLVHLMPDASIMVLGEVASTQVPREDRMFSPGDADLGVSTAQQYWPPYLYADAEGTLRQRPVIEKGPDRIGYGQTIELRVDDATKIEKVSLVRTGFVTHTLALDNRLVMLSFDKRQLRGQAGPAKSIFVRMPKFAHQATPGDYMLFVVNDEGTPSMAKHVRLVRPGQKVPLPGLDKPKNQVSPAMVFKVAN
jgi:hypothetical protein